MNAQPFPHALGDFFEDMDVVVFFGNRHSTRDALETAFPQYRFIAVKQTHSDIVVASPYMGEPPEADAHFSRENGVALCIRTADCIPVLIFEPRSRTIAAIHAGWRGVENEIILKTCDRLSADGLDLSGAYAWIGPHIGSQSFEVGKDVALQLEQRFQRVAGHSDIATSLLPHENSEKARVNLTAIARAQLLSRGFARLNIQEFAIDTVTSIAHESHRRDREKAGRQTSFIALKR